LEYGSAKDRRSEEHILLKVGSAQDTRVIVYPLTCLGSLVKSCTGLEDRSSLHEASCALSWAGTSTSTLDFREIGFSPLIVKAALRTLDGVLWDQVNSRMQLSTEVFFGLYWAEHHGIEGRIMDGINIIINQSKSSTSLFSCLAFFSRDHDMLSSFLLPCSHDHDSTLLILDALLTVLPCLALLQVLYDDSAHTCPVIARTCRDVGGMVMLKEVMISIQVYANHTKEDAHIYTN
jgi:hypothetical protein